MLEETGRCSETTGIFERKQGAIQKQLESLKGLPLL